MKGKNSRPFRKDKSFKVQGLKFRNLSLAIELNVAYKSFSFIFFKNKKKYLNVTQMAKMGFTATVKTYTRLTRVNTDFTSTRVKTWALNYLNQIMTFSTMQ